MAYSTARTDYFDIWYETLGKDEKIDVDAMVEVLEERGPMLPFPYSSGVNGSKYRHMRELRIQHKGRPYRILYAFDPLRVAILLLGGDKTGDKKWYDKSVPVADRLYGEHIIELKNKGEIK